jgi:tetratricopeptide (TPR) repeat protein
MPLLRLKLADLQTLSAPATESLGDDCGPGDAADLEARIRRQFRFLPDPITVKVEGDEVVVEFPEETPGSRAEAARLAEKAGKRASEGNYGKAIDIYQRVLELQPSLHRARRDLAMIYAETGDVDNATNHLIEVLRLDPSDSWNWVVLGNLYAGGKNDPETAEKFIRKALELNPNDPWALNSLATFTQKAGRSEEALALFDQAIAAHPDLPNPYLGKALVLDATKQTEAAAGTLEQLFTMGRLQDARSHEVYDNARNLYVRVQAQLAERQQSEAFKCVQNEKAELVALSGYPLEITEGDLTGTVGATIQMAWKHRRDHHVIISRRNHDPILLCHLEAHELTHLRMETEARKVGRNRFFSSNPAHREVAMKEVASDLRRFSRNGYSEESLTPLFHNLIGGLCSFVYNCPLDMLIERHLRETFPALRPCQFLSVRAMANDALKVNLNRDILKVTPRKIYLSVLAMNGAYCLGLDQLFGGATAFADPYRKLDNFAMARRLHDHWTSRADSLSPGDEYDMVDEFAEMLGIRGWFDWIPDMG